MTTQRQPISVCKQITFIYALYGIRTEDIPVSPNSGRFRLSPRKLLDFFRRLISEDRRTEDLIKRAQRVTDTISRKVSFHGIKEIAPEDKERLKSILKDFRGKCLNTFHNKRTQQSRRQILDACVRQFIQMWNIYMQFLEGKWLLNYGRVFLTDLEVKDSVHLSGIVSEALNYRLVRKEDRNAVKAFIALVTLIESTKTLKLSIKNK